MVVVDVEMPETVRKNIGTSQRMTYKDIIRYYENSFEYEYVGKKAWDFKDELLKELLHD